jgi:hypothetical protein
VSFDRTRKTAAAARMPKLAIIGQAPVAKKFVSTKMHSKYIFGKMVAFGSFDARTGEFF